MSLFAILLLALGLSADAFAVSLINGLCMREHRRRARLMTAACFGLCQAAMPVIGYCAGRGFADFIAAYAHIIALALLAALGGKMIAGAAFEGAYDRAAQARLAPILLQGVATSVDALSVGFGLALLSGNIALTALIIGTTTFVCCFIGFGLGARFGASLAGKAMVLGGVLLIAIGLYLFFAPHAPGY
jgi:putative Mn2+ efflux pump MntP